MNKAIGFGINWLDNCRPNCVSGTYYPHQARLRAFDPQNGRFTRLWTRIKYRGRWHTHVYTLVYSQGSWYWGW
jgi:hypothetical protein